jgi:hypothetical protein
VILASSDVIVSATIQEQNGKSFLPWVPTDDREDCVSEAAATTAPSERG